MTRRSNVFLGGALLLAAGCGKTTTSSASSADKACGDLAGVRCDKRASCTGGAGITRTYGDMTTCLAREKTACLDALSAPGTGNGAALVEDCVAAFPTFSCADFADNKPPAACAPTGRLPDAADCAFNGQCASGFCSGTKDTSCGVCAPSPVPGDDCSASTCGHGQLCVEATAMCQNRGTLNDACDSSTPCGAGLSCTGDTATAPGTCQNALTTAGSACGGALPGCDGNAGLHCGGPAGTAKTCLATTFVAGGMPCGTLADGSFAQCVQGDCYSSAGLVTGAQMGTCRTDAADGTACDTVLGPGCTPPARCVPSADGMSGICTVPLGETCG